MKRDWKQIGDLHLCTCLCIRIQHTGGSGRCSNHPRQCLSFNPQPPGEGGWGRDGKGRCLGSCRLCNPTRSDVPRIHILPTARAPIQSKKATRRADKRAGVLTDPAQEEQLNRIAIAKAVAASEAALRRFARSSVVDPRIQKPQTRTVRPVTKLEPPAAARLDWEILPQGWWTRLAGKSLGRGSRFEFKKREVDRIRFIESLGPIAWYEGREFGVSRYFVALFNGVAVADCPDSGNALYYYRQGDRDWKDVFRRNKMDAIKAGAKRLYHAGDWKGRLRRLL